MNQTLQANLASAYDDACELERVAKRLKTLLATAEHDPGQFAGSQTRIALECTYLHLGADHLRTLILEIEP